MKPEDFKEIFETGDEYLEIFRAVLPYVKEVGADIKPLLEKIAEFHVETTCTAFDTYIEHGFSREEALQLVLFNKTEASEFIKRVQVSKG